MKATGPFVTKPVRTQPQAPGWNLFQIAASDAWQATSCGSPRITLQAVKSPALRVTWIGARAAKPQLALVASVLLFEVEYTPALRVILGFVVESTGTQCIFN